jgi:hypothetical protein
MFSKEDSKRLREEFWISFGKSFPTKWLLYNTKIKDFSFKFHFDTKQAWVSLDIEGDLEQRIDYWEKLLSLKSVILEDYLPEAQFEEYYLLENGKEISRMFVKLEQKVSIHNKNTWQEVMLFFNETMPKFEMFFEDFREVFTN